MTKMQMESKLGGMVDKLYLYKQKEHRIVRFKCEGSFSKLVTTLEDIIINHDEAKEVLANFLLVDEDRPHNLPATKTVQAPELSFKSNVPDLSKIVMANIEKLKEDAGYIGQANAINDQLKTLIDLGKAEIEMAKMQIAISRMGSNN